MKDNFELPEMELSDFSDPVYAENYLLRSILALSLSDFMSPDVTIRLEAESWFFSKESDYIFSYRSICTYLELDAEHILTQLITYRDKMGIAKKRKFRSSS